MSELSLEFGYSYIEVQHILGKMSVCKLWWENCLFAEMGWGIHYSTDLASMASIDWIMMVPH